MTKVTSKWHESWWVALYHGTKGLHKVIVTIQIFSFFLIFKILFLFPKMTRYYVAAFIFAGKYAWFSVRQLYLGNILRFFFYSYAQPFTSLRNDFCFQTHLLYSSVFERMGTDGVRKEIVWVGLLVFWWVLRISRVANLEGASSGSKHRLWDRCVEEGRSSESKKEDTTWPHRKRRRLCRRWRQRIFD